MSKTTVALLVILCLVLGALLFVLYSAKQNPLITSLTHTAPIPTDSPHTTLTFMTNGQTIGPGQTVTLAVTLTNPESHPTLAQLEIGYDPTALTVDSLRPGTFFANPTVALENIDSVTGRISYALRCPVSPTTNEVSDCIDTSSSTLALLTVTVNSYALRNTTTLTFLPKTVIRTRTGHDILQKMSPLQLPITKQLSHISSTSAIASLGANFIRVTPVR